MRGEKGLRDANSAQESSVMESQGKPANPTLWRTCRVLANKTRIQILRDLIKTPPQSVSTIAETFGLSRPVASQRLRSLNARGLLESRRSRPSVTYSPIPDKSIEETTPLLNALKHPLVNENDPVMLFSELRPHSHISEGF